MEMNLLGNEGSSYMQLADKKSTRGWELQIFGSGWNLGVVKKEKAGNIKHLEIANTCFGTTTNHQLEKDVWITEPHLCRIYKRGS
jgi:hypothetical protein